MNDETLAAISALFALGTPLTPAEPVSGGLSHRVWRVETDRGTFAIKQMNRDPAPPDYVAWYDRAFSLEMAAFDAGIPMPGPIPVAATGRCLAEIAREGEPTLTVRVHEWVDGEALQGGIVYPPEV